MEETELKSAASEYLDAIRTVRIVKSAMWLLVWAAIMAQLVCFILVQFVGLIDPPDPAAALAEARAAATRAATAPATAIAPARPAASALAASREVVRIREQALGWLLRLTKFVAPVACMVLSVALLTGLQLSLVGRLGGASGLASSFFWSIILLVMLVPWQRVLPDMLGVGVLYNFQELTAAVKLVQSDWDHGRYASQAMILHYVRFLAYPVIVLLVWMLVGVKFAKGLKKINRSTSIQPGRGEPVTAHGG